jgi:hypothetical protein
VVCVVTHVPGVAASSAQHQQEGVRPLATPGSQGKGTRSGRQAHVSSWLLCARQGLHARGPPVLTCRGGCQAAWRGWCSGGSAWPRHTLSRCTARPCLHRLLAPAR